MPVSHMQMCMQAEVIWACDGPLELVLHACPAARAPTTPTTMPIQVVRAMCVP
jgi:hypothetical protein